jgi:sec-independent protein translocase protein TatA
MALVGYEWLIIVAVLLIIFLWGPQKLPELARSIGLAKKELEKASKEPPTASTTPAGTTSTQSPSDSLVVAAKELGISTEGKTKDDIAKEIADKAVKK